MMGEVKRVVKDSVGGGMQGCVSVCSCAFNPITQCIKTQHAITKEYTMISTCMCVEEGVFDGWVSY